jgi:hypothetical protein
MPVPINLWCSKIHAALSLVVLPHYGGGAVSADLQLAAQLDKL